MATIEERIYDANRAKEVIENEAFVKAFEDIRKDLIESWENIPSTHQSAQARDRIHLSLTLLKKVHACLTLSVESGKLARLEIEHRQTMAQRLNPWSK